MNELPGIIISDIPHSFTFVEIDLLAIDSVTTATHLLEECLKCGGSVTAEHGIGVEKIDFMARQFSRNDLRAMERVKGAFNPSGYLGPGKLLPRDGVEAVVQTAPARRGLP